MRASAIFHPGSNNSTMSRGRSKLPQEVLNLRGTNRKDRARPSSTLTDTVKLPEVYQRCQISGLKQITDRARYIYWRKVEQVAALGILEEAFCHQLLIYAVEYDHWITCCESIEKEGPTIIAKGKDGQTAVFANPAVKQRKDAEATLIKIGANFGFSPIDRQRSKMIPDEPKKKNSITSLIALIESTDDDPEEQ